MPTSGNARVKRLVLPHSEAAIHWGIAGELAFVVEEDLYVNQTLIPSAERRGVVVYVPGHEDNTYSMTKSEAGWSEPVDLGMLALAIYRVIADPHSLGLVYREHLYNVFIENQKQDIDDCIDKMIAYGAIGATKFALWPVPYEA